MSAAKLALKPTDKDCQQRGERDSFWQTLMPGLITGNYREEAQSKGRDGAAVCGLRYSGVISPNESNEPFLKCWKSVCLNPGETL